MSKCHIVGNLMSQLLYASSFKICLFYRITTNVQKVFCPHCGNKTLTKVSMTVNEDGSIRYFLSRRQISKRGKKVSGSWDPVMFGSIIEEC